MSTLLDCQWDIEKLLVTHGNCIRPYLYLELSRHYSSPVIEVALEILLENERIKKVDFPYAAEIPQYKSNAHFLRKMYLFVTK